MKDTLLAVTLVSANRVRSFLVRATSAGWEVSESVDRRIVQERCYTDWHRVEHTLRLFRNEIAMLRVEGWRDA